MELDATYDLRLNVDHSTVELLSNGSSKVSHTYRALNHENPIGLGTYCHDQLDFRTSPFEITFHFLRLWRITESDTSVSEIIDVLANDAIAYDIEAALQLNQTDYTLGQVSIIDNQLTSKQLRMSLARKSLNTKSWINCAAVTGHVDITVTSAFPSNSI